MVFGGFDGFVGWGENERSDVADFRFDADAVAVFLGGGAGVDGGGALEVAEGVAHGFVAAAQNPVDNFALTHDVKVIHVEVAAIDHGLHHVAEELEGSTSFVAMIVGGKSEVISDEVSGDRGGLESDFVEIIFVF